MTSFGDKLKALMVNLQGATAGEPIMAHHIAEVQAEADQTRADLAALTAKISSNATLSQADHDLLSNVNGQVGSIVEAIGSLPEPTAGAEPAPVPAAVAAA